MKQPEPAPSRASSDLICVCMLAYNHAHTLARAVQSVLAQEYGNFELFLSDDCSTDSTWEVIQALARQDSRIRPVRTSRNLGMAGNANFTVNLGKSRYIALLHHDDIYAPNLLTRWLDVAERHPTVGFVSNAYAFADPRVDYHPFEECTPGKKALQKIFFPSWGCPVWGTTLIRRSCWDEVGGMRERFGMLADVDLWMRLAGRWDVGYVREPLITLLHERPHEYPKDYVGWSWPRLRLLYEIHGINREEYFDGNPFRRGLELLKYRGRVTMNELFIIANAAVKRRWEILATSDQVANRYELAPARVARQALAGIARGRAPVGSAEGLG